MAVRIHWHFNVHFGLLILYFFPFIYLCHTCCLLPGVLQHLLEIEYFIGICLTAKYHSTLREVIGKVLCSNKKRINSKQITYKVLGKGSRQKNKFFSSPVEILERRKKGSKKSYLFPNGPALYPPPPLNGSAIKRRTFLRLYLYNQRENNLSQEKKNRLRLSVV